MAHDDRGSGTRPIAGGFGARIRYERQVKGWTRTELARQAGIPIEEVERIERGEIEPSLGIAIRLSTALDVSLRGLAQGPPPELQKTRRGVG